MRNLQAGEPALRRAPAPLLWLAGTVACALGLPLVYLLVRSFEVDGATWSSLLATQLGPLLATTIALALAVTVLAAGVGTGLAFLVERTDLPARSLWRVLCAMPLVIPPYVGAFCYLTLAGPQGLIEQWLAVRLGVAAVPQVRLIGFPAGALVLVLTTYPFVYLLAGAQLRSTDRGLIEAARACGQGPWQTFRRVTLPLLAPAVGAGSLLVALYAISDFGVVSLLRVETFTAAIYLQLTTRFDRAGAAVLSAVLVVIALGVLWAEQRAQGGGRVTQMKSGWRPPAPVPLGPWRVPALLAVGTVVGLALVLPFALLVAWTFQSLTDRSALAAVWTSAYNNVWQALAHSLASAAAAATIATVAAFPVALLWVRYPSRSAGVFYRLSQLGYALPGLVVALSLVFVGTQFVPWLYGTVAMVLVAYVVRFLPEALQGLRTALSQLSPTLEEASRSLGCSPMSTLVRVSFPLLWPSFIAAWALVFLSSLRELPATLLLRPAGFDTLPIRIWIPASESVYTHAAPAALLLVLCSLIPLAFLFVRARTEVPR
ncbi:ABC transporter permease [Gloeobacter violaceus]|uniref:Iron(III) ABC transporter permease protein n=1 Tax=Gloeobacter violaceus (strain ATCC 29082 / PCC 7421) TaxID=251221 RepID=Q7NLV6_GLOVI|nr:iron ABC transporter permease [Gloeobacter violaceus]BAC88954.1 iron(III) ABC transporter permease protein [Gloeobacter violaceus PCC 7421]